MKVTPVIRGFCCDCSMALCLFDLFTSYVVPTRHVRWRCVVHHFRVKKVKGQGHTGRSKFWPCPLHGSIPFWPIHFICCTHAPWGDDVLRTISGSKGQGHTGWSKFLSCRSAALSLLDRFTSNVVHTQPIRWQYVAHHFWVRRSKVKVTQYILHELEKQRLFFGDLAHVGIYGSRVAEGLSALSKNSHGVSGNIQDITT